MNLAVIGLGHFGTSLAMRLKEMHHHVTALDLSAKAVGKVQDKCDVAVVADATDRATLEEIGLGLVEAAVVCIGQPLGASILATLHLKEMGLEQVVAKATSMEHEKILKKVGANQVIFPERESAHRLAVSLASPNLMDFLPLGGDLTVAEVAPPSWMVGKSLLELDLRKNTGLTVLAVRKRRSDSPAQVIQDPGYQITDSDLLVMMGQQAAFTKIEEHS